MHVIPTPEVWRQEDVQGQLKSAKTTKTLSQKRNLFKLKES